MALSTGCLCRLVVAIGAVPAAALSGSTFLDRPGATTLRVATYNVAGFLKGASDSLFQFDPGQNRWHATDPLRRIVQAIDADVWAFQEIVSLGGADLAQVLDEIVPIAGGAAWSAFRRGNQITASRHGFSEIFTSVVNVPRSPVVTTIDLPDAHFDQDLHLINVHLDAGQSAQNIQNRQDAADALVAHLRDARSPDGTIDLPADTSIMIVGDFNAEPAAMGPLHTILTGDIADESTYGPDSAPDWDGTDLADPMPIHNGRLAGTDWTFASRPGTPPLLQLRLDHVLYTDSVLSQLNTFVLNTRDMTVQELASTALSADDVLFDPAASFFDHLPVVVDFRSVPEPQGLVLFGLLVHMCLRRQRRIGRGDKRG